MKVGDKYIYKDKIVLIVAVGEKFVHFKIQGSNTKNYALKKFFLRDFIPATELTMALS